jgi:hypothetical protein
VSYRNDSDKVIKAVEFNIVFIDAMGDKHTYAHTFFEDRLAIKPGKKGHSIWSNLLYDYCRKYEVTVLKVAFEDGTVWKAPSTTN